MPRSARRALAGHRRCATVAAVVRCSFAWRLIAALCVATLPGAPVVAQEAAARTEEAPGAVAGPEAVPAPVPPTEQRRDYWPLLVAGIGVTAGGLAGARLARLEYERWDAIPDGAANRDAFGAWTVAGSVAATVGVGLIVLWATIRLSEDARPPARPGGGGE